MTRIVILIPARLASSRFPRKILVDLEGLPMIEHVRRRALLSRGVQDVVVATCDSEIFETVTEHGGRVKFTSSSHENGTSRIAEAVQSIDCSHVILLQGDEPLILPRHIEQMISAIQKDADALSWNLVGPIADTSEMDRSSFVKCSVGIGNRVLYCYRRSPSVADFTFQNRYARKMLGVIGYRKEFLIHLASLPKCRIEEAESIEQMRIIENGYSLCAVDVEMSLPSVNEPHELEEVLSILRSDPEQCNLLDVITKEVGFN